MQSSSSSKRHLTIANKREGIVRAYLTSKNELGAGKAARALGVSGTTLWRWSRAYRANGVAGLMPKFHNSGRRSAVKGIRLSPKAVRELERLIVSQGNVQRAWLAFSKTAHCPAAVARMNFRSMPAPVMRLVQLRPLQARCYISAATGTVYFRLGKGGAQ